MSIIVGWVVIYFSKVSDTILIKSKPYHHRRIFVLLNENEHFEFLDAVPTGQDGRKSVLRF